jgi:opacity protein-like surface antigen
MYWNDAFPSFGVGFDIMDYQANSTDVQVDITSCSFLFMLRGTIGVNERYRSGWLQPYIGIGLMTYHADVDVDFTPVMSMKFSGSSFMDSLGLDFRTGIRFLMTPNLALYGEWKYSSIDVEINSSEFDFFSAWRVDGLNMETTHIGGGLSLIF